MSRSPPAVSVILPTYNRSAMIGRTIDSVLRQTLQDFELIVVDDASTDDTESLVASYDDRRIRYVRHAVNAGACVARNTGILGARGRYVAFLDSDDEWLPDKLAVQIDALERSSLSQPGIVTCGEVGERSGERVTWLPRRRGWVFEDLLCQRMIGCRTSSLLVSREVLQEHSILFDPELPARQDWDFVARVSQVCQLEIVRRPLVVVHHHDGDRVWTPVRAIRAGEYLHDKFAAQLAQRPRSHSRFHLRIALSCLAADERRQARRHVRQAIAADPLDPVSYGALALTFLDKRGRLSWLHQVGMKMMRPVFT